MKVLIIRFSSIGDIVLTSPVLRSIKRANPATEIHYLTKAAFGDLLIHNPYVDQLHFLDKDGRLPLEKLKSEQFDHVLDLHHNLRSLRVKWNLGVPTVSFLKKNLAKFQMVRSKKPPRQLPHIVERYGDTLGALGMKLDTSGLELFLNEELESQAKLRLENWGQKPALAVVLGATHATKRWPVKNFVSLLNQYGQACLLIGGPDTREEADWIVERLEVPCFDAVGKFKLLESAALMKQMPTVITHDTGFMHIAAAFGQKVISLWGNTVPEMGMIPYKTPHEIVEVKGLSCRPCSKIGFDSCPKGHFKCMEGIEPDLLLQKLRS